MRVTILLALWRCRSSRRANSQRRVGGGGPNALGRHRQRRAFDALTALLKAHNLPFTVETFTLDKPPAAGPNAAPDPRTRGRNVVVTLGEGPETIVVGAHYDAK
jgi:hypothetical protein